MSNYFLHFPDGDSMKIDTLFHDGVISVGDKVFFDGEEAVYRVAEIQHQIKRPFRYMITNVILEEDATE